jgi:hypothetical protein
MANKEIFGNNSTDIFHEVTVKATGAVATGLGTLTGFYSASKTSPVAIHASLSCPMTESVAGSGKYLGLISGAAIQSYLVNAGYTGKEIYEFVTLGSSIVAFVPVTVRAARPV